MQMFTAAVLLASVLSMGSAVTYTAQCDVEVNSATPDIDDQVTGTVIFTQEDEGEVTVDIDLEGFSTTDANILHGFHVHETGNISDGCTSSGSHYNPEGVIHGGPNDTIRHVGDLGNIEEDTDGACVTSITDDIITLTGNHSILARAIVVHQLEDDLGLGGDTGSITTGNAGPRVSCCVIVDTTGGAATYGASLALLAVAMSVAVALKM